MHDGDVDADLLENAPPHQPHGAAAALGPLPRFQLEAARRAGVEVGGRVVLEGFQGGAEARLQLTEPGFGGLFAGVEIGHAVLQSYGRARRKRPLHQHVRLAFLIVRPVG